MFAYAVLHIADFALHAALRQEPAAEAAARPAALFAGTGKRSTLLAANSAARTRGVAPGMTSAQALARCPGLLIRSPDLAAEAEARALLLAIASTLAPAVEDTAPGLCTIDLKGHRTAPTGAAAQAIGQLAAHGLPATAGLARTPLLALYAARTAAAPPATAATQTELPLAPASPPGVATVTDEAAFLAPLPLATAEPPSELAAVLAHWGLRTLGDLTALPRDDLMRRFGAAGLALWQRATGGDPRPLHLFAPSPHFEARREFEHPVETLDPLLFVLRRFLERLALELQAAHRVAAELTLTLQLEDEAQHERGFRLPEPTADPDLLFRALHTHLESLQTESAIVALHLQLTPTRPLVRQQGLFDTGLRDPHGFAETLARLAALTGADRVGTPQRIDTHRPDSVRLVPPPAVVPPPAPPPVHAPLGPPLRRYRPPLPARVEFTDGRPTFVFTDKLRGEVLAQGDAWPANGDWWQADRAWQRIEWDIALADGGLYRLLLVGDHYFIEGEYD